MRIESPKEVPFLREYLAKTASDPIPPDASKFAWVAGLTSWLVVLAAMMALGLPFAALAGVMLVAAVVLGWLQISLEKFLKSKIPPTIARKTELRKAATKLNALKRKQLPKALGPGMAELMEEAAKDHNRAHACLNGPFWTNPDLSSHWKVARDQALASADEGMGDLVLIAEDLMTPVEPKPEWQEIAGEVIADLFNTKKEEPREPLSLPPEFAPARAIADRLRLLFQEAEQATMMVINEPGNAPYSSLNSLEAALTEIQQVKKAEAEARQDLRQL